MVVPKLFRAGLDPASYMGWILAGSTMTDTNTKLPRGCVGNCQPSEGSSLLAQNTYMFRAQSPDPVVHAVIVPEPVYRHVP